MENKMTDTKELDKFIEEIFCCGLDKEIVMKKYKKIKEKL